MTSIGTDTLIEVESIRGTNFDDIYVATGFNGASSDIPSGTTFNEFEGMDGNDTITGNGNTRISYLNASAGVTVILSGSGSGTAQSTAAGDLANVGIDTFTGISAARGSNFNDTFTVAVDNTPIAIDGRNGSDTVNYSAYTTALTVTLNGGTPAIVHGSGSDDAHSDMIFNVENFVGGTGADTVTGDGSNNIYFATVDTVRDVFDGGAGNSDTANYSAYSAALTVVLNGSTPTVVQGSGSDDAHSDTIVNVENFVGGTGADIVTGDAFNNTYSATVDNVRDIFDGGAGNNTADYSAYAAGLSVTLTGGTPAIVHGSGLDDAHSDTIANVENVIGGSGNDVFTGDANNNIFNGGAGFDEVSYQSSLGSISVSLAAGTVTGGASIGTDTLRSIEYVFGTNASDTYDASNFSSSSINAGSGTFNIFVGGGGDDAITGNGNTQVQYFNATSGVLITLGANGSGSASGDSSVGNDSFSAGVNNVLGSNFNDTYNASAFTSSSGSFNQFQGLDGNDTITGNGSTQLYYAGATAGISVTLNAGGSGTVAGDISVGTDTIIGGVNSIQGSNFNDTYNASTFSSPSGSFNQFLGNGGNDTITGNGNTQLYYGATTAGISATLNAGGTGTVTGDSSVGSDTINGGVNNIFGSNFNDTFTLNSPGANFQSTLTGNGGNDTFVFKPNFGKATITDFHSGQDTIDFDPTLFADFNAVQSHMTAVGANTVITFDAGDTVTLVNVAPASLHANDFHFV